MSENINYERVKKYFEEEVPALPFVLASESAVNVDVGTINKAEELANSFVVFLHPDVTKFLELIAEGEGELPQEALEVTKTRGYLKFLFWLTVYCGRLPMMLELHAVNYAPSIGIDTDKVGDIDFYPHVKDKATESNPYASAFNGDVKKLIAFVNTLENSFVRFSFDEGYQDVSAVDILGYI